MLSFKMTRMGKVAGAVALCMVPVAVLAVGTRGTELSREGGAISVSVAGRFFCSYRFATTEGEALVRPFLYPLNAADGTGVTSDQVLVGGDHRHHRSMWIGHGDVNGGDHWEKAHRGDGVPVQQPIADPEISGDTIVHVLEWEDRGGERVMRETRSLRFFALDDGSRCVDLRSDFSAVSGPVTLGDTKEAGLCAVRMAGSIAADPRITNATGQAGEEECWGRSAAWCDISGSIDGSRYGIAILDHPGNPRHPSRWHVRRYGLMAANIFGLKAFEGGKAGRSGDLVIEPGRTVSFIYRVIVHEGDGDPEDLAREFEVFSGNADPGFVSIFDGKTFDGWRVPDPNSWWAISADGVLVGASNAAREGHELETEREYRDLVFETEVRFEGDIDSGVFFRKNRRLQVQIGVSRSLRRDMTCSIYAGGYPGKARGVAELLRPGDWNRIRVIANGPSFRIWLNGVRVLEYWDETFRDPAPVALQIHGGVDMKVEFRGLKVKEIDPEI